MASDWNFVSAMLGQVDSLAQVAQLGQNQAHQQEQIHWARRSYKLDSQSIRLEALDHAKEEIKVHYDTYVGRIDTLLLMLTLIFPFALNVIQFSDPFVPSTAEECPDCVESKYRGLTTLWACLIGVVLVLPFWGILMMIRCKLRLDRWFEYSLAGLHNRRREIVEASDPAHFQTEDGLDPDHPDQDPEQLVFNLVSVVLRYQEIMAKVWNSELGGLVQAAVVLLWLSAGSALLLTALSMWIFLVNKGGEHAVAGSYFAVIISVGCIGPVLYLIWHNVRLDMREDEAFGGEFAADVMHRDSFPLAKHAGVRWRPINDAISSVTHFINPNEAGDLPEGLLARLLGGLPLPLWCPGRRRRHRPRLPRRGSGLGSDSPCSAAGSAWRTPQSPTRAGSGGREPLLMPVSRRAPA